MVNFFCVNLSKYAMNKRAIFSLGNTSLRGFRISWHIDQVQNRENLHLGHTLYSLVEAIEGRVDRIDELICGVTVLQTSVNAVLVHLSHENFELIAVKDSICVNISCSECFINLGHETLKSFLTSS